MSTTEDPVVRDPTLDGPSLGHVAKWRFPAMYPNTDRFTALCGARLMGVWTPGGTYPACEECERLRDALMKAGYLPLTGPWEAQ